MITSVFRRFEIKSVVVKSFALSLWYVGKAKTHSLQDLKKMDHLTVFGLSECFNSGKKTMTNIVNIQPTPV